MYHSSLDNERVLSEYLVAGNFGEEVLERLLPSGKPHDYESSIWDYKAMVPDFSGRGTTPDEMNRQIFETIKDVVSFYNTYGGYIVYGVDESRENSLIGISSKIDTGRLNEKIVSYVGESIECRFATHSIDSIGQSKDVGILFIPKRPVEKIAVKFRKSAKADASGKQVFSRGDTYGRFRDSCRPAGDAEDYQLLLGARTSSLQKSIRTYSIQHNIPAADPNLIKFVGRKKEIDRIWEWLFENRDPVRFVTGYGGLGKTSLVYEFCQQLTLSPPVGLDSIVWLTGKSSSYSAIRGEYHATTRTDFKDATGFLTTLLVELGLSEGEISECEDIDEFSELAVEALSTFSTLVVLDDVDGTGDPKIQADLVACANNVFNRAFGRNGKASSRIIFTSRLEIGVGPGQVLSVSGLDADGFFDFIVTTCEYLNISFDWKKNSRLFKKLHKNSQGSPLFAGAILRLVKYGEPIEEAIHRFNGQDGEDVRQFAFQRELSELTETQTKILLTILLLGETTFAELGTILELGKKRLLDDLSVLRQYHMLSEGGDPSTGIKLSAPSILMSMIDIVSRLCISSNAIKKKCAAIKVDPKENDHNIGFVIRNAINLIQKGDVDESIAYLQSQISKFGKSSANLYCLLGRAYMSLPNPAITQADKAFREAYEKGCSRTELYTYWMDAKYELEDWRGVIQLSNNIDDSFIRGVIALRRLQALYNLAVEAHRRGDPRDYEKKLRETLSFANRIQKYKKGLGEEHSIVSIMVDAAGYYLSAVYERVSPRNRDHLDLFHASMFVYDCYITRKDFILAGCRAILNWRNSLESKEIEHGPPQAIIREAVSKLRYISDKLSGGHQGNFDVKGDVEKTILALQRDLVN